jgi:hypothetical protein
MFRFKEEEVHCPYYGTEDPSWIKEVKPTLERNAFRLEQGEGLVAVLCLVAPTILFGVMVMLLNWL